MLGFILKTRGLIRPKHGVIPYTTLIADKWPTSKVRQTFVDYFCIENQHKFIESSSVIPPKGSGTYFTNAGMNQFKSIILGESNPNDIFDFKKFKGLANSQKCIRIGNRTKTISRLKSEYEIIESKGASTRTWTRSAKTTIITLSSKCSATGRSARTTSRPHVVWP